MDGGADGGVNQMNAASDSAETQLTRPPPLISGHCPLGLDKGGNWWLGQTDSG